MATIFSAYFCTIKRASHSHKYIKEEYQTSMSDADEASDEEDDMIDDHEIKSPLKLGPQNAAKNENQNFLPESKKPLETPEIISSQIDLQSSVSDFSEQESDKSVIDTTSLPKKPHNTLAPPEIKNPKPKKSSQHKPTPEPHKTSLPEPEITRISPDKTPNIKQSKTTEQHKSQIPPEITVKVKYILRA